MTSPDHVQHLNVLNCNACGAPVPLGDSASTVCLRCGAVAPLPQAYRDLRDAERAKHATDAAARHLYQQLGKPPGSLARWWSTVPLGWIYFFGWPIVFVAAGLAIPSWLDRMAPTLGFSAVDVLSQTGFFATIAAVMFLLFGVPLALAIYGYRRTKARGRLHMALAAAPPPREGGPMQCRSCGGALTVHPIEGKLLCRRRYIIPMQKGETLTISAMRLPAHVTRFKVAVNLGNRPYNSSGRIALTTQNELRYTAPWCGWHELEFSTSDVAPQEKPAAVFRLSTRISQPVTPR